MGWFSSKTDKEKLTEEYQKLTKEAFELSHTNRSESDKVTKKANDILEKIKQL